MQIVTKIFVGHAIQIEDNKFNVIGTTNIRGRYSYVCSDKSGRRVSLRRDDVLQAQREGTAKVVMA